MVNVEKLSCNTKKIDCIEILFVITDRVLITSHSYITYLLTYLYIRSLMVTSYTPGG